MADRHANERCGTATACSSMTVEDVAHMRCLAYESLAREAEYLHQHAEGAWMAENVRCGEDAEVTAQHVRRTFRVLDGIGWTA